MKIFPSSNEKLITAVIFSSLIGLCLGIVVSSNSMSLDFVVTSLVTLLAAYIGVKMAFELQNKKQREEIIRNEVKAGNRVIFELIRTYNKFLAIEQLFIAPRKKDILKHLLIPPIAGTDSHRILIDYDSLSFLFKTKKADILNSLSSFEQSVNSTIEVINQRSDLHFNVIQPAIEKAEKEFGSRLTESEVKSQISKRNESLAKISTDHMIAGVDNAIELSQEYIKELGNFLEEAYPDHKIIKMEIKT